ncbi:hypothetical protein HFD88_001430 [Aspergillus terreus]|nr:hypothetical protein HFD88_001430 [Aspergillus terreus]
MKLSTIILGLCATLAYASPMIQEHEPTDVTGQEQPAGTHPGPYPPWPYRPWPPRPWPRPFPPKILESPVSPRQDEGDGGDDGGNDDGNPFDPFQDDDEEDGYWDGYFE